MAKLPWMKFYPADWLQDTAPLSLAGRGAWSTIISIMWSSLERGKLSLPIIGFCRILGTSEAETLEVIDELVKMGVCDTVTEANKNITLICRRMIREYKYHKNNALRQERYRVTHQSNADITGEKSEVRSQKSEVRIREDKNKRTTTIQKFVKPTSDQVTEYAKSINFELSGQKFCDYYEANGWKVGRNPMKSWQAAIRTWKNKDIEQENSIPLNTGQHKSKPISPFMLKTRLEILEQELGSARNLGKQDDIRRLIGEVKETKQRIKEATK